MSGTGDDDFEVRAPRGPVTFPPPWMIDEVRRKAEDVVEVADELLEELGVESPTDWQQRVRANVDDLNARGIKLKGTPALTGLGLAAFGGWCAPLDPMYDFFTVKEAWEYKDRPFRMGPAVFNELVAPRFTAWQNRYRRWRSRIRLAWGVLTSPAPPAGVDETEEDWW